MKKIVPMTFVFAAALSNAGCFGSQKDVSSNLERALQYKAAGELTKARLELQNAMAVRPNDARVNLELAKLEDEAGDLQSAIPHYVQAAAPDAHLIEPQLRVVQVLLDSDRYADAAGRINAAVGAFPGNADALALRADLSERQGKIGPAKADADAALQKDRNNPRAIAVLAMLELREKNGPAAITLVDRGLTQHPKDLRLLQVRAAAFLTLNQPDKAVEALMSIVRASPRNVAIQKVLAQIEAKNGHLTEAVSNFQKAVDADPSNQDMQLAFVGFLASQSKGNDVVAYLEKLIEANPKGDTYDLVLAEYFRSKNELDQARIVLDRAAGRLRDGTEFRAVAVARAKLEALVGRVDIADQELDSVLAADPQNEEALLLRAILDADNGRTAAAISHLLKVVRQNPVSARAFQILATSYLATDQPKMAVDAMQRAVAVAPGDESAEIKLAAFLQRARQIDATRDLMARLTLQNPDSKEVWASNAQLAIDRKDWPTASRSIARLRELPDASLLVLALDGRSKAAQGDNAGAAKSYQDAIASDPAVDPGVFGAFARASVAIGRAKEAADFLEHRAPTLKPDAMQQAWSAIMTLRADAGQFDMADRAFLSAERLAPGNADIYSGYVKILLAQKDLSKAKEIAAAGLAAGAPKTSILLLIGAVDELGGNLVAAAKAYKDALASNPLSLQAANNYGSLLADQDPKNTEALGKARDLLSGADEQGNPSVLDTMAWLDYRLGRFDEAKRLLTQANASKSQSPQVRFHLAAVLMAGGDRQGGLALLDTVKGFTFPGVGRSAEAVGDMSAVDGPVWPADSEDPTAAPLVSVVIPHYNDLANLGVCLAALRGQTVAPELFEVIVVDNNSRCDRAELEAVCRGVRLIDAPIQGAAEARNAGVRAARAPCLAFLDSDCRPDAAWLAAGMAALDHHALVGGRVDVSVGDREAVTPTEAFEQVFAFNNERYIREETFSVTANLFTTRAVFEDVGGFRTGVAEDYDWGQRAAAKEYRWHYAADAAVEHPARRDWRELTRKWKRLTSEGFALAAEAKGGRRRWIVRSWLMLLSVPLAALQAARSPRVARSRDRWKALAVLIRLRWWRFIEAHRAAF